ncbi:MAG: hypothetical protein JSR85_02710 [Proteobacteria bacterium]|nr:hypothetical protein [Pseudomonadota bacterium]
METLKCIWGYTDLEEALLIYGEIGSVTERRQTGITNKDPIDYDQQYVDGIIHKIRTSVFPIFDKTNSLDDILLLAEKEEKMEREKRELFSGTNIYRVLINLYAAKGWKDKTLEMCDKDIEKVPATARHLAEEDKKKYIKYFDQLKDIGLFYKNKHF